MVNKMIGKKYQNLFKRINNDIKNLGPVYPQSSIATVPLMYNFSNVGFSHNAYNVSNSNL